MRRLPTPIARALTVRSKSFGDRSPPTSEMVSEFIQVITTTATQEDAREIAGALVERRLAGCVQIVGPIESIYRWGGKTETATEWQCLIKTRSGLLSQVEQAIRAMHKYDVPEIIALPIVDGSEDYLRWLLTETANG